MASGERSCRPLRCARRVAAIGGTRLIEYPRSGPENIFILKLFLCMLAGFWGVLILPTFWVSHFHPVTMLCERKVELRERDIVRTLGYNRVL
jgi:hypothetical protein